MKNHIIGIAVLGMLLSMFSIQHSYADRITHLSSGKCVHPKGRPVHPAHNTNLVLHSDDCANLDERLEFSFKSNGHLVHNTSGKCIVPKEWWKQINNNEELVLVGSCNGADLNQRAKFVQLPSGQLQHVKSGKCIHPYGGWENPGNDTNLVLYSGCTGERIKFSIAPIDRARSQETTKLYHSYSGKCVHPKGRPIHPGNNTRLVLHGDFCDSKTTESLYFTMQKNGSIKHISSGKCIHPHKGLASYKGKVGRVIELVLYDGCVKTTVRFKKISTGAIQHESSGKCIQPFGESVTPNNDTLLILDDECSGKKSRMNFK